MRYIAIANKEQNMRFVVMSKPLIILYSVIDCKNAKCNKINQKSVTLLTQEFTYTLIVLFTLHMMSFQIT